MNTRNSVGVASAWEPGISVLNAWVNPVVRETQAVVALNLQTINQFNGEALKVLSAVSSARNPAEWPAIQWNAANGFVALCAAYSNELAQVASRLNEAFQEVGQTQAKKNDIQVRAMVGAFQSRTQAAASAMTSAVATALSSSAPTPEVLAQQHTDNAIARAARRDADARPHKAVVD